MRVIHDDLWFCPDCTLYVVNGDFPDDADESRREEIDDGARSYTCKDGEPIPGYALVWDSTHEDEDEGADTIDFTWRSCDCCDEGTGGSRTRFALIGPADDKGAA